MGGRTLPQGWLESRGEKGWPIGSAVARTHNSLPSLVSPRSPPRDQMVRHPISLNASLSCLHVRSARPHSYFHPPPSPVINPSLSLSLPLIVADRTVIWRV